METNSRVLNSYISTPQHPLPDEIRSMQRDETVCKYCGISYLIHAEVKALQDRLKAQEEEVKEGQDAKNKLRELNIELHGTRLKEENLEIQIKTLQTDMYKLHDRIAELSEKKVKRDNMEESIVQLRSKVTTLKDEMVLLMSHVQDGSENFKKFIDKLSTNLEIKLKEYEEEKYILKSGKEELNIQFTSLKETYLCQLQQFENLSTSFKQQLSELQIQYKDQIDRLRSEVADLSEKLSTQKRVMEDELHLKKQESELAIVRLEEQVREYQLQIQLLIDNSNKNESENMELHNEVQQLRSSLLDAQNTEQMLKLSLKKITEDLEVLKNQWEELVKSHEVELTNIQNMCEMKIKAAWNQNEKLKMKLKAEKGQQSIKLNAMEAKLKKEYTMDLEEREKHIDSLKKASKEADQTVKELEAKLTQVEKKNDSETDLLLLRNQLNELKESELSKSCEISDLKAANHELLRQLEQSNNQVLQKHRTSVSLQSKNSKREELINALNVRRQELENDLTSASTEIKFLRETVRQECEERRELTEALGKAKQQLLILNKPTGGYSSVRPTSNRSESVHGSASENERELHSDSRVGSASSHSSVINLQLRPSTRSQPSLDIKHSDNRSLTRIAWRQNSGLQ